MEDFSLIEKMSLLVNIILSSPLFLFCTTLAVALLIFYIISIKKYKKVNKWIFISVWIILALIIIINYSSLVFGIIDNLFDAFFKMLYFPNVTTYTIILLITNLAFFYSIFSKRIKTSNKVLNFINALLLDVFLILVIDVVSKNNKRIWRDICIHKYKITHFIRINVCHICVLGTYKFAPISA